MCHECWIETLSSACPTPSASRAGWPSAGSRRSTSSRSSTYPTPRARSGATRTSADFDFDRFEAPEAAEGGARAVARCWPLEGRHRSPTSRTAAQRPPGPARGALLHRRSHRRAQVHGAARRVSSPTGCSSTSREGVEVELPLEIVARVAAGGSMFPHTTIVVDEHGEPHLRRSLQLRGRCPTIHPVAERRRGRGARAEPRSTTSRCRVGTQRSSLPDAALHRAIVTRRCEAWR